MENWIPITGLFLPTLKRMNMKQMTLVILQQNGKDWLKHSINQLLIYLEISMQRKIQTLKLHSRH